MARPGTWTLTLCVALGCGEVGVEPRAPDPPTLPALQARPALALCVPLSAGQDTPPSTLSATGCFTLPEHAPAADVIPFVLRSPLWSDGAVKDRYLVLPPGTRVSIDADGAWSFPIGSILIKSFSLELEPEHIRPVETRLMIHDGADSWRFFTYRWREDGSDADLLDGFASATFSLADGSALVYDFPDAEGCDACHVQLALGPRSDQLDIDVSYAGRIVNQLDALAELELFDDSYAPPLVHTPLTIPADETATLEQRARSYLHANCAHCHRPGGWAPQTMNLDLRIDTPLAQTQACGVRVQISPLGADDLRITPGDPDSSAIFTRTQRLDDGRMAPIGTHRVDPLVEQTVGAWIESLSACPAD